MKTHWIALLALGGLATTPASAQMLGPSLTGPYQCIENCAGTFAAYVTQNGWELNLTNEIGQPTRAWIDWPGHLWAEYWHEGAVYSPDGATIQFDNGSVWQRIIPQPVAQQPIAKSRY
jgi:hypothetical protein